MQNRFYKLKFLFLILCFLFNKNFINGMDNAFLIKAESIINNLESKFKSSQMGIDVENFLYLKDFIYKKINTLSFNLKKTSYSELASIFTKIDKSASSLLSIPSNLSQEDRNNFLLFFNSLKNGLYFNLSLDHLLRLKKSIMKNIDEIIALIDYWEFSLENRNIQGKIEAFFSKDELQIKTKLKKLFYLKNRMASYLGKIEELLLSCNSNDTLDSLDIYTQKEILIKEVIFCINSFFVENFNPDFKGYKIKFNDFCLNSMEQVLKKFLANHMNILLLGEGSRYLLRDYKAPGFLRRNWLKLFFLGNLGVLSGVYFYKNWNEIIRKTVIKIDTSVNDLKRAYSYFIGMINNKLDLNIPGGENVELDEENITEKIGLQLRELKRTIDVFRRAGQKCFGREFGDSEVSTQDMLSTIAELRTDLDVSIEDVSSSLNMFSEKNQRFAELIKEYVSLFKSAGSEVSLDDLAEEKIKSMNWFAKTILRRFGEDQSREIQKVLLKIFHIFNQLESLGEQGVDRSIQESLKELVSEFNVFLNKFFIVGEHANGYLKMYEGLAYEVLSVILDTTYNMILVAAKEVDKINNELRVTVNWVKISIPVILTAVVIPLTSFFLIRKILKNNGLKKQAEINNLLVNIYRVLNINNRVGMDINISDLSYKDRGLLNYFITQLDLNVISFLKSRNSKLAFLLKDLKNPNLTVNQKLDFIKAWWGYSLFEESLIGA